MKSGRFGFLLTLILALAALAADARVWSADDVPMVHLQDQTKYVCDPEGLLSDEARDSSDVYLRKLHAECGVQTVFVVVGKVKNADCFRMAQDIGNKYGVGTKKERLGLVVVVAVADRKYFVAPGKGLEGDLTDVECDDIARACIVANMRVNDTDMAVWQTSKALYHKLKTGRTGIPKIDQPEEFTEEDWLPVIFMLLICFGGPILMLIRYILETYGIIGRKPHRRHKRRDDDDWFPPFIFGGGGRLGGGIGGGSFGGGSFGGGGAGGGW